MVDLKLDEVAWRKVYEEKMDKSIEKFEEKFYFINSKQLSAYLNMSWNTITEHLLYRPGFPKMRKGPHWLFPKKEVEAYMDKYYLYVCDNGGDMLKLKESNIKKAC